MPSHQTYVQAHAVAPRAYAMREGDGSSSSPPPLELETIPWGVRDAGLASNGAQSQEPTCEIIATFGEVEAEYAAIRAGAGLLDCPHLGVLIVDGSERSAFLDRMLTQEFKRFAKGEVREAFWLNRKGRIEADLRAIETGESIRLVLDRTNAASAAHSLNAFIFTEDVQVRDVSDQWHCIAVHGRRANETLAFACGRDLVLAESGCASTSILNGVPVIVARQDETGEPGFLILSQRDHGPVIWSRLLEADAALAGSRRRVRPIGWHAYNIARIEAGTPLYNIDFGPTNLPHETGLLQTRVSFTKGCYLGQEVVARMQARGHSKASLVGLRIEGDGLPVAGAQVFARNPAGGMGDVIGTVTSSTLSPMCGSAPIAFAMIRSAHALPGQRVLVDAEGAQAEAVIGALRFWPKPVDDARAPG